jgi:hypothetical protein
VDPVPDPLLLTKSGSTGNLTRDLFNYWVFSRFQEKNNRVHRAVPYRRLFTQLLLGNVNVGVSKRISCIRLYCSNMTCVTVRSRSDAYLSVTRLALVSDMMSCDVIQVRHKQAIIQLLHTDLTRVYCENHMKNILIC